MLTESPTGPSSRHPEDTGHARPHAHRRTHSAPHIPFLNGREDSTAPEKPDSRPAPFPK